MDQLLVPLAIVLAAFILQPMSMKSTKLKQPGYCD